MLDHRKMKAPLEDYQREWLKNNNRAHLIEEIEGRGTPEQEPIQFTAEANSAPYEEWKKDELKSEIQRRNGEMDDDDEPLPTSGDKSELIQALRDDDEAIANASA